LFKNINKIKNTGKFIEKNEKRHDLLIPEIVWGNHYRSQDSKKDD
jgi:hypothetical protein